MAARHASKQSGGKIAVWLTQATTRFANQVAVTAVSGARGRGPLIAAGPCSSFLEKPKQLGWSRTWAGPSIRRGFAGSDFDAETTSRGRCWSL